MIEYHRSYGHQVRTPVCSQTHRVIAKSERRPVGCESRSATRPDASRHPGWEMLAVWGLVVFSFAALLLCMYIISVKCHTGGPF